jgi:hypothetical protein
LLEAIPGAKDESPRPWWRRTLRRALWSWLSSCLFHVALLMLLALVVQAAQHGSFGTSLMASLGEPKASNETNVPWEEVPHPVEARLNHPTGETTVRELASEMPQVDLPKEDLPGSEVQLTPGMGSQPGDAARWMTTPGSQGGSLEGRSPQARARLVHEGGGSAASEEAVERGLRWLVAHQNRDGSWHFNHQDGPCQGLCRNPGSQTSTTAATALALLPFLGAGYTHLEGEHITAVRQGLYYLGSRAVLMSDGADLQEGTMYGQGLAAIALCEAYGMTHDPGLKELAQRSIDFIVHAQDRNGGGWRYAPGQPGDTTVTGWQLMALKSGQMAGCQIPSPTWFLAERFLDSVQSEEGAKYGYMSPEPRPATTAVGLLCRMYSGWDHDHPAIEHGVAYLSKLGPSKEEDGLYFNYYATQVLRHYGGPLWDAWNARLRDALVAAQATEGHEAGSWYFPGSKHSEAGGRLYTTSITIMTLEVYYRYLPLYTPRSTK